MHPLPYPQVLFMVSDELNERLRCSFVIIDKPRGPSSHEVAAWVKKLLGAEKSGHAGTLDPDVTGVLPVAIISKIIALKM